VLSAYYNTGENDHSIDNATFGLKILSCFLKASDSRAKSVGQETVQTLLSMALKRSMNLFDVRSRAAEVKEDLSGAFIGARAVWALNQTIG
jgi:hypothetical protein